MRQNNRYTTLQRRKIKEPPLHVKWWGRVSGPRDELAPPRLVSRPAALRPHAGLVARPPP